MSDNKDPRKQKIRGCLIVFIIFGGFMAMGGTAIYLSEINSRFVFVPVACYFGVFIVIAIVSSIKNRRHPAKNGGVTSHHVVSGDGEDADAVDKESDELVDNLIERCDDDTYDLVYNAWNDRDNEILDGDMPYWNDDKLRLANTRKFRGLIEYYDGSRSEEDPELIHITAEMMASYFMRDDIVRLCDEETFKTLNDALAELTSDGNRPENVALFQSLIDSHKTATSDIEPKSVHITESEMLAFFAEHGGLVRNKYDYAPAAESKKTKATAKTAQPEKTATKAQAPTAPSKPSAAEAPTKPSKPSTEEAPTIKTEPSATEIPTEPVATEASTVEEKAPTAEQGVAAPKSNGTKGKRPTVGYRSIGKK